MTILFTPTAEQDLEQITTYLVQTWSERARDGFLAKLARVVTLLKINTKLGRVSQKRPDSFRYTITKHNFIYYQIDTDAQIIYITSIEDSRSSKA